MLNRTIGLICVPFLLWSGAHADNEPDSYASAAEIETFCDRLPRAAYANFELHPASDDWFQVYEVDPGVWAIYEPYQWQEVISYLIVGDESGVLFDTGNGIGDIRAVVDRLTEKSIVVINSHGHFDHIGGNYQFDDIASISTRFSLSKTRGEQSDGHRMEVSPGALCKGLPDGVVADEHSTRPYEINRKLSDGERIDLGGRTLEVIQVPGHTDDSVALLDRANGLLWVGDSFYEGPIWLFAPETDLAAYRKSVARMASLVPDLAAVFPAHNTPRAEPQMLVDLQSSLEQALSGDVEPEPVPDELVEFRFDGFSLLMRSNYHRL